MPWSMASAFHHQITQRRRAMPVQWTIGPLTQRYRDGVQQHAIGLFSDKRISCICMNKPKERKSLLFYMLSKRCYV
jgi:hypothetical protein